MIYLSKGILPWNSSEAGVSVSHCGLLHKLTGVQAELWLAGQRQPGQTRNAEQDAALKGLAELGIAVADDGSEEPSLFRLLTNCAICPALVKRRLIPLRRVERSLWRWIRDAGLRLTMAELTLLTERDIKPIPALLGEENRQKLTEAIYTRETIFDGILETLMGKSPARDEVVQAVLNLLRRQKIFLL
jgi:hypothetical protein